MKEEGKVEGKEGGDSREGKKTKRSFVSIPKKNIYIYKKLIAISFKKNLHLPPLFRYQNQK